MPLGERNVPLPPDNDGTEAVFTPQATTRYPPPRCQGGDDSPVPARHPGAAVTAR